MSALVEQSPGPSWRKRPYSGLDVLDLKRTRYTYIQLEADNSRTSDDDTESVCSLQEKETDYIRDTSDTESKSSVQSSTDEYEVAVEYEVGSDEDSSDISSPESDMMVAVAAAMICNNSLEAWVTDVEDSDSSSDEISFRRLEFSTCLQCKTTNPNPLYRYCDKCFQDRKKLFPARPRRKRCSLQARPFRARKVATLKNYQSGLSQDSGVGMSEEMSPFGLEPIIAHLQKPGTSATFSCLSKTLLEKSELRVAKRTFLRQSGLKRPRQYSESSLSEFEVKKVKMLPKPDKIETPMGSELVSCSSPSTVTSVSVDSGGSQSEKLNDSQSENTTDTACLRELSRAEDDKYQNDLCMFCNSAPKDSIFLHANMAHRCCCYACAKRTMQSIRRCPLCNGSVEKILRMTSS